MKRRRIIVAGAAGAVSFIIALPAFAEPLPAPAPRFAATFGTVVDVSGDEFTLAEKRPEGEELVKVALTDDTTVRTNGVADAAADIAPGQQVVVRGTREDGALNAASVNVMKRAGA
jgi:hypothetical protein